jgi:hypothetical protein
MRKPTTSKTQSIRITLTGLALLGVMFNALLITPEAAKAKGDDVVSINFVGIAQRGDDPPGITGPLLSFGTSTTFFDSTVRGPAIDEARRVIFVGRDATVPATSFSASGVFLGDGTQLFTIADRNLNPPGVVGNLIGFEEPDLSSAGIVFTGRDASGRMGIFADPGGILSLRPVAQIFDEIPGFNLSFNTVDEPNVSGTFVSFKSTYVVGTSDLGWGIHVGRIITFGVSISPDLYTVVLTGDDPPGIVGPFYPLGYLSHTNSGPLVAFSAQDEELNSGIFTGSFPIGRIGSTPPRKLQTIISTGDPLPGSLGSFLAALNLDMYDSEVSFWVLGSTGRTGVCTINIKNGSVSKIAEQFEDAPGPMGYFDQFQATAISDSLVAFSASDAAGNQGLFVSVDGNLRVIVDSFTTLDGKTVSEINFVEQGLSGTSLAFAVKFTDGSEAIYRADLEIGKIKKGKNK